MHIDGQSTVVDAPPDIIDVPDEDDDIIDDEDALPHDLADSNVEDLINVDDDGVEKMSSADVARSHDGDGGGEDRPPPHHVPTGCGGCFINRGKGTRKPNLGGRGAGRMNTRDKTRNLSLKEVAEAKGPVSIQFDVGDKKTLNPLGPHAAHWSNYIREVIRTVPLYYPSWEKVPKKRKATFNSNIRASDTQEYPSLIDTFWRTHTVDGVFPKDEDRRIYEEMKRLEATGEYTEDEINRLARGGKLRGHIPGVGRVLPARATSRPSMPAPDKSLKSIHKKVNFMMSLFRSDSKYSDMFKEFESGGAIGSGGCGDDEESGDDEDEDGDGDY
ncbi:hypothetical protein Tco_0910751 [Tanacetum coccineum]|uniref:Uncharacterized protein n=1 Tax=Tanacetum coccineum TaxID=301880 RepID=A0ABQ5CTR5_9ASTR